MPRPSCEPCCNPEELSRSTASYRAAQLQILCQILEASGGAVGNSFDWELLCTTDGIPVLVRITYGPSGAVSDTSGFNLDGTAYVGSLADLLTCGGGGGTGATPDEGCCCYTYVRDEDSLVAALTDIAGKNIVVCGDITLTDNRSINKPLTIVPGYKITTDGHGLYIVSSFVAGNIQCFVVTGTNQVIFGPGSTKAVIPEWFGALGNSTADDTAYFNFAIVSAALAQIPITPLPAKTYFFAGEILPVDGTVLGGDGYASRFPTFKGKDPSFTQEAIIRIANKENVWIKGINFVQDEGDNLNLNEFILSSRSRHIQITNCIFRSVSDPGDTNPGASAIVVNSTFGGETVTSSIIIDNNKFYNSYPAINLQIPKGDYVLITKNYFESSLDFGSFIEADNSLGIGIKILDNEFVSTAVSASGTSPSIGMTGEAVFLVQGIAAEIRGNLFKGLATEHINIYSPQSSVIIDNNNFYGVNPHHITLTDLYDFTLASNFFGESSGSAISIVRVSATVLRGLIDEQFWGTGAYACASEISASAGVFTNLIRVRHPIIKDISANRPTFAIIDAGSMYLDTTLDADGLPIIWTGSKWIKFDGTDA